MAPPIVRSLTEAQQARLKSGKLSIYRYVRIGRLLEILRTEQLPFMKISKWDDPFEGYLVALYCKTFAQFDPEGVNNRFAFSCWSLASESDHIWRLYTPNKDGVRISVSLRELLRVCPRVKAGAVGYPKQAEIKKRINEFGGVASKQSHLFFVKRFAFRAEQELRLMVKAKDEEEQARKLLLVPFDTGLIRGLRFDPRMDVELFECLKSHLVKKYDLDRGIIMQSLLYQPERVFESNPRAQRKYGQRAARR